jgi:hypothetical protein
MSATLTPGQILPPHRGIFFPNASLHALGRGRLHPPSAPGLHSHLLGGFSSGKQRWHTWTCRLRRGGITVANSWLDQLQIAVNVWGGKP